MSDLTPAQARHLTDQLQAAFAATPPDTTELLVSFVDASREELEEVVGRGLETFIEVGMALMFIRDRRLYTETHETWDTYLRDRWGMERSYAHRTIEAAKVASMLPVGNRPANERHARELGRISDESKRRAAWEAVAATGEPTAALLHDVAERVEAGEEPETVVPEVVRQFRPGPKTADRMAQETGKAVLASDGHYHTGRDDPPPHYLTVVQFAKDCAETLPDPEEAADLGVWSNHLTEAKTDEAARAAHDWLGRFIAARKQRRTA